MSPDKTVLIVDDDADDRLLFVNAVKEADPSIVCLTAGNGLQALDLLEAHQDELPVLIFLDLRMPRFGGRKCLKALQDDARFKNIPVVIYTTSRSEQESDELQQMGARHFMSKPTNPEEIYYLVSLMLEEHAT